MNYKDKFNAQMKKAGINSLDDLKTDAEKKAFFKAVDKSHDAKNEELLAFAEEAINEFKLKDSDVEKLKKGVKQGKPIKVFKLNKPVKAGYGEDLDEAKFTPAQISALQKAYAPLKGKTDYKSATGSKMNFNKLKNKMKSYSVSHLQQLSVADIPMVSDAAKELL